MTAPLIERMVKNVLEISTCWEGSRDVFSRRVDMMASSEVAGSMTGPSVMLALQAC